MEGVKTGMAEISDGRYPRVNLGQYCVISIWFGCNSHCTICMLSRLKEKLPSIGFDLFRRVTTEVARQGKYDNLILSGGEVTTFGDLDRYVRFAASLGWFKRIQIQTNGRKLSDRRYVKHLVDCGVNEFFISVHGLDEVHDKITQRPGSFKEVMMGIKNLEDFDVNTITNTVLTKSNTTDIVPLMNILSKERISEIQLWNYFPMERTDTKDFVVSMRDFLQLLPELLATARSAHKAMVLKSFPLCLPAEEPGFFDSIFPGTALPDVFWREFQECGFGACPHNDLCSARECWGLSNAYINKYGEERDLLRPIRS